MEHCEKCNKETYHKVIRRFPTPKGHKVWVSCSECNNIKLRVMENDS